MSFNKNGEIDLGFAEKCDDKYRLTAIAFPSKLGGRPSWLNWENILTEGQVQCGNCSKILQFLCQIYIPTELNEKQYHRTLYLFCCSNGKCYISKKPCVKAFRSILEETDNDLTEDDLETKSDQELKTTLEAVESSQPMCAICSLYGDKKCSGCHNVCYCSKEHQVYDWKCCGHKAICKEGNVGLPVKNKFLFEEYEVVIEQEPTKLKEETDKAYDIDESRLKDLMKEQPIDKKLEKEFSKATANTVDEYFDKFKKRIKREPNQIIRYCLGGTPLWVSSENIATENDIPDCQCGSKRQFEFQVLPQMLNYLGIETTVDSIDWGILCVYTCEQNCRTEVYKEEFVWKQDFSNKCI